MPRECPRPKAKAMRRMLCARRARSISNQECLHKFCAGQRFVRLRKEAQQPVIDFIGHARHRRPGATRAVARSRV